MSKPYSNAKIFVGVMQAASYMNSVFGGFVAPKEIRGGSHDEDYAGNLFNPSYEYLKEVYEKLPSPFYNETRIESLKGDNEEQAIFEMLEDIEMFKQSGGDSII